MRNYLKKIYLNMKYGKNLISDLMYLYKKIGTLIISDEEFLKRKYKRVFGVYPDLISPKLFTEKIQWLRLNERTTLHTLCADKHKVKQFVSEKIGANYIIPSLFETKDASDINPQNMPNVPVIIKTNHDSGGSIVINNSSTIDYRYIQNKFRKKLRKNFYYSNREWEYKNIEPMIIVEKLLTDKSGNVLLNDYKIYCFNGKPLYIQTINDRFNDVKEDWYDVDWNQQDVWYFSNKKKYVEKPVCFNEMIHVAKKLSSDFKYVRVDLYEVNNKVYFGELTFHPWTGLMKWHPKEWDKKLGDLLILE